MEYKRIVSKCIEAFTTVLADIEEIIAFAPKMKDRNLLVTSLESYSEAVTTNNDKIITSAQIYVNSASDKVSSDRNQGLFIRSKVFFWWFRQKILDNVNLIT